MWRLLAIFPLLTLLRVSACIKVFVPQWESSTTVSNTVVLQCDFITSANLQDVIVTWRYKPFCREPESSTTSYQPQQQEGLQSLRDCPDGQHRVSFVIQKIGTSDPVLGAEYHGRNITIQNKADLVIAEAMLSDNGMYLCSVDAAGDTTGDSDKEVKLIVKLKKRNLPGLLNL